MILKHKAIVKSAKNQYEIFRLVTLVLEIDEADDIFS